VGNLELNQEAIRRANNASQFDAGDVIKNEAEKEFQRFDETFRDSEEWTQEQKEYLTIRRDMWKHLVTEAYNEALNRRADFVPVNVAGPAGYDADKAGKKLEIMFKKEQEYSEKLEKFLDNTWKRLEELTPIEVVLERYRNSGASEVISSDDPYAIEKLKAELEYCQKLPRTRNNSANIRRIKQRIEGLEKKKGKPAQTLKFKGGRIVANYDMDRLQIYFDEKPDEEMRSALKRRGFRCAPSQNYAWQRQLTNNAIYAAKQILSDLINN